MNVPADISAHELGPFRSREPAYFIQLVNLFQDLVVGYIFGRIGRINEAHKLAILAFSDLYNHVAPINDDDELMLTLFQYTKTCCEGAETGHGSQPDYKAEDQGADVANMLQVMAPYERLIAIMAYVFGSTRADIACFTHLPLSAVQRRLDAAHQKLPAAFVKSSVSDLQQLKPSQNKRFINEVRNAVRVSS
ncbi:MAG TPA: hypothetical protein EYQ20_01485 [candidate division Zixibacteria bacterium]|jgi:hypothetical protein|nr:hypothetical protein [candidate division Zixibacteria bacterium]